MTRYPLPLISGGTIGICAPSSGVTGVFAIKMDFARSQLEKSGYNFIETASVRKQWKLTSASASIRAQEFKSLYLNDMVDAIIPPWGGEFLMDMLPYLDFEKLGKARPKWVMGFSDTSTLLFVLTMKLNIASAHGPNLLDFGNLPVDKSVLAALDILNKGKGEEFIQYSLDRYQEEWLPVAEDKFPPYQLTEKVEWKILSDKESEQALEFQGRLIGGNLDVICKLIGTPYAPVDSFIEMNKKDGIVWYFESCEMNSSDIYRTLWQMKQNGWFENCSGVLYGRLEGYDDVDDFEFEDALSYALAGLNIPLVYDVDLGHKPPQLLFINGAYAKIKVKNGKGELVQKFI